MDDFELQNSQSQSQVLKCMVEILNKIKCHKTTIWDKSNNSLIIVCQKIIFQTGVYKYALQISLWSTVEATNFMKEKAGLNNVLFKEKTATKLII